jgi:hypothetical protein
MAECLGADNPRPILTPKTVLPLFFVIGIIFAPIGGLLLYASAQVPIPSHPPNIQPEHV